MKKSLFILIAISLFAAAAWAENKSGVEPRVLSLPSGPGSIEGLGESFEPNLNTGSAKYVVKLDVCPGPDGFQPAVSLSYDSGFGNDVLGLGWKMDLPFIQRQTDKGLPRYQSTDAFIYAGHGELAPLGADAYRLKIEGLFSKFQMIDGPSWEVDDKSGTKHFFGATEETRLTTSRGVFKWLPDRSVDPNGNVIRYHYFKHGGNAYLDEISYGTNEAQNRSVRFEYEDRPDIIADYRSRSEVLTGRRLKCVSMFANGSLVRKYVFNYTQAAGTVISLLKSVTQFGRDGESTLPPFSFSYTVLDTAEAQVVKMQDPPAAALTDPAADLVDINGDSLPDIVHAPSGAYQFYLNLGAGRWREGSLAPSVSPGYPLSLNGVFMADLDGDGLSDLIVQSLPDFGYFKNTGKPWEKEQDYVAYAAKPLFSLQDPNTRLVDVNNDSLVDVLYAGTADFEVYLNHNQSPWTETVEAGSHGLRLSDPHVHFADMNGDRMEDLVVLDSSGNTYYLPNLGFGTFGIGGQEIFMSNSPFLSETRIIDGGVFLMDINGDGLSDLVQVDSDQVSLWLNRGDNSFGPLREIAGTPGFNYETPAIRQADMNGDGCRDILFSFAYSTENNRYQYLSFCNGSRPNLLTKIDNGLGREIKVAYRSSTEYYLAARTAGNPWATSLPFPVEVVSQRVIVDKNSGQHYVTDFTYRDGYYDGREKEFRGFASVDKIEYGDATAPTVKTHHEYDVGKTEESRKGMMTQTATLQENGTVNPPSGLYQKTQFELATRELATGENGQAVRFSFSPREDTLIYENTSSPKQVRTVFDYDDYGNETKKYQYGLVEGGDLAAGGDEILTDSEYYYWDDASRYMVDRPKRVRQTYLDGTFLTDARNTYDGFGNLTLQEKSPDGARWIAVVRNEYDAYGNIVKMTDANGHYRTIQYDSTFHTFPVKESLPELSLEVNATYDAGFGKVASFTNFNGHSTQFGYDVFGRLVRIVKPGDSAGLPTQSFEYHLGDPRSSIVSRSREISGQTGTYDTYAYFDGLGRKLQTRSEAEDGQWVVSEAQTFNLRQQPAQKWLPYFASTSSYEAPNPAMPYVTTHYDPTGRAVKEINPDTSFSATVYSPLQKQVWDEEDNAAGGTHAATPHSFVYDGLERLVRVDERNGAATYSTRYGYDGLNNLVRIEDDHHNVKTMQFDGLGRKTFMDDPDKGEMRYGYDDAGNLIETVDNKGQTVGYGYDAANRILTESFNGVKIRYHYDRNLPADRPDLQNTLGKLSYIEDEAGRVCFSHDPRGNVLLKARQVEGQEYVFRMSYDAMNRLTGLIYPDAFKVDYQYNSMNQLEAIPGFVTNIDYDASGQKSRFVYANGIESTYQYDLRRRLKGLKTSAKGAMLQDLAYSYDRVSNIAAIEDQRTTRTPEDQTRGFTYDDLYRLTRCTAPNWYTAYGYDSIGNLIRKTSDVADSTVNVGDLTYGAGSAGPHAVTQAGAFAYSYDGNGNLQNKTGYSFQFDHKDRMARMGRTADGLQAEYRYDYGGNRVVKSVTAGGSSQKTIYLDRYAEVRNGELIEHVFAGDRRVALVSKPFDGNALMSSPVVFNFGDFDQNKNGVISMDEIKAAAGEPQKVDFAEARDALRLFRENMLQDPAALPFGTLAAALHGLDYQPVSGEIKTRFYIPDHLGSASIVTDKSGNVVEESVYYPYGMNRLRSGAFESEYRFTGKELDDESDLHYFGARYYDAMVGRFVSVDPLKVRLSNMVNNEYISMLLQPQIQNGYSYCRTNPVRFLDDTGLWEEDAMKNEVQKSATGQDLMADDVVFFQSAEDLEKKGMDHQNAENFVREAGDDLGTHWYEPGWKNHLVYIKPGLSNEDAAVTAIHELQHRKQAVNRGSISSYGRKGEWHFEYERNFREIEAREVQAKALKELGHPVKAFFTETYADFTGRFETPHPVDFFFINLP